jgi:hypothetical protein
VLLAAFTLKIHAAKSTPHPPLRVDLSHKGRGEQPVKIKWKR